MKLESFSDELVRMFNHPGSVTRRQGAEFAARLYAFLNQVGSDPPQSKCNFWSVDFGNDGSAVRATNLCNHAQFMQKFDQVLTLGLDKMRQDLMVSFSTDGIMQQDGWSMLKEAFLHPISRLSAFSRIARACTSPLGAWLATSVLIGHRTLCLADQIRQRCLEQFIKHVAPTVSIFVFKTLHCTDRSWSSSDLDSVLQYVRILQQYQSFQTYLSKAGYLSGPYEAWEDAAGASGGTHQFNIIGVFVEPYLDSLKHFYRPLLQPFDAHQVARSVGDWLIKEESLAVACNIPGFRDAAVNCLLQETVQNNLEPFGEAVQQLMMQNDSQGLSLFLRIMVMVEGGLDRLLEVLRGFVRDQMLRLFDTIRSEFESLDPNSAKATSMFIEGCVSQMRFCKSMIDLTEPHPSLNRNLLTGTVRTGIADVLNCNPLIDAIRHPTSYPATALAHHFHRQLRALRVLNNHGRDEISDLLTLYSLIEDKEAFLTRYHVLLRERLLSDGCDLLSLDAENFALENLTQMSGWKAVYEVKSVLKDFNESEEFNNELRNLPEYQCLQRDTHGGLIPLKFTFVRGYFWRMSTETVNLPAELAPIANLATDTYLSNHAGRSVQFAYAYGSGLLAFSPSPGQPSISDGEVMLRCSTAVMILLLNFNERDCLSALELHDITGIRQGGVNFYLHHLAKSGLLVKLDRDGDPFSVNEDFRSGSRQVNLMVSQQQHSQRQKRRLEKLDQRMKEKRVQCAIVSLMKQLRHLARTDLFHLVQSRLPNSTLHSSFFAEQLSYLVSGGYISMGSEQSTDGVPEESMVEYIP